MPKYRFKISRTYEYVTTYEIDIDADNITPEDALDMWWGDEEFDDYAKIIEDERKPTEFPPVIYNFKKIED